MSRNCCSSRPYEARFGRLAEAGVQHVIISIVDNHPHSLELLGRDVIRSSAMSKRTTRAVSRACRPPEPLDLDRHPPRPEKVAER